MLPCEDILMIAQHCSAPLQQYPPLLELLSFSGTYEHSSEHSSAVQVRDMAVAAGIPSAVRRSSAGICFVGEPHSCQPPLLASNLLLLQATWHLLYQ